MKKDNHKKYYLIKEIFTAENIRTTIFCFRGKKENGAKRK